MGDLGKALGYIKTIVGEVSRPKSEAPFAHLPIPEGGPESGLVICSVCKKLQPPPPSDWHLLAKVDDPSGKVRGFIGCCSKCRKTNRSTVMAVVSILAILCGVAFTSYALTVKYSGIDPESHWFGSTALTVAEWTGKNHENIEGFVRLLDLLVYAGVAIAGVLVFLYRRIRKSGETETPK
jgi:hypothetical protein